MNCTKGKHRDPRKPFRARNFLFRLALGALLLAAPLLLGAEYQTHTVKKGDTLFSLGKRYGVSVEQIKELNGLPDNRISLDQVLKIKEGKPEEPKPKPAPQPAKPPVEPPAPKPQAQPVQPPVQALNLPDDHYYTVQAKDNLYRISVNHGLTLKDLLQWNNFADVTHAIHPGDRLIVKNPAGATLVPATPTENPEQAPVAQAEPAVPDTVIIQKIYVVQKKDTLYSIAKNNGMTVDELKSLNNLSSNAISVGQRIWLAGRPTNAEADGKTVALTEAELQKSDRIRGDLAIPVIGKVSSEYGLRNGRPHKGIDISAKSGTPIHAVLDGVVVFSGVQGNYGNVVVVEHPDFVMTVYAHNSRNLVKVNDRVTKGQLIGYVGATGNSTGPHLHFEYRIKGKAINPRKVVKFD